MYPENRHIHNISDGGSENSRGKYAVCKKARESESEKVKGFVEIFNWAKERKIMIHI